MTIIWIILLVLAVAFLGIIAVGSPYVPSRPRDLKKALTNLYPLSSADLLVDLGAGDGIVLRTAAAQGATAHGIELNPFLVMVAKLLNRNTSRVSVSLGDLRSVLLPAEVTVVYTFPNTKDIDFLTTKLLNEAVRLKHDFYLISMGHPFQG